MTLEEALEIIETNSCYECSFGCISAYTCECETCNYKQAVNIAVNELKRKRPHREWIPVTYRPMDEEEYEEFRSEFGELPFEERKMFSCHMPEDDQEILICTSWGGVCQDRCELDELGYALETQGDWDGVIAWMPLPDPYEGKDGRNV